MAKNIVWGLTERIWDTIKSGYSEYKDAFPNLVFHDEKKECFDRLYRKYYEQTLQNFMTESTEELDSHKQAAIITICCLQAGVLEYNSDEDGVINLSPELIAINVGLSYMLDCLNEILAEKKIKKRLEEYYLPVAFACDTSYELIIGRILHYEKEGKMEMKFNVLELADRYFLLEYINLLQHGIEPSMLRKDWKE